MSEGVEQPADLYLNAQRFAAITLRVQQLANERFAAWHVVVGHHIHAAHDLQSAFLHELAKRRGFLRVTFEEWFEIRHLIQGKAVVRMFL